MGRALSAACNKPSRKQRQTDGHGIPQPTRGTAPGRGPGVASGQARRACRAAGAVCSGRAQTLYPLFLLLTYLETLLGGGGREFKEPRENMCSLYKQASRWGVTDSGLDSAQVHVDKGKQRPRTWERSPGLLSALSARTPPAASRPLASSAAGPHACLHFPGRSSCLAKVAQLGSAFRYS